MATLRASRRVVEVWVGGSCDRRGRWRRLRGGCRWARRRGRGRSCAPAGSGVAEVMPAAARAAELATAMWPSVREKMAGWPAVTGRGPARVGSGFAGPEVWSQPPPRIQVPGLARAWRCSLGCALHVGERAGAVEVDGELLAAGLGDVGVGVVEAGHGEGAVEVDELGFGALELEEISASVPMAMMVPLATARAVTRAGVAQVSPGAEVGAGEDVAVEVDGIGGGGAELGSARRGVVRRRRVAGMQGMWGTREFSKVSLWLSWWGRTRSFGFAQDDDFAARGCDGSRRGRSASLRRADLRGGWRGFGGELSGGLRVG